MMSSRPMIAQRSRNAGTTKEVTLKEIARVAGGRVVGDDSVIITGINSLDSARPGEISFLTDPRYRQAIVHTRASAMIVGEEVDLYKGPQVVVADPGIAYAKVAGLFAPPVPRAPGISEQAVVDKSSCIGKGVSVYPMVYIGKDATVGDDVILFPGVFVGDRVSIGNRTILYPNVSILQDCSIGSDVIIHAGTVIGSDGFGFVRSGTVSVKIPQIGTVRIDDHVEIGANNCIDRAALGKTWIKRGVKTDNLVHVAHNVVIGEDTIVVAQVGISGSVHIGREVIIGGQVGIVDHVEIGDRAMIGSQSGIAKSVPAGEAFSGTPAMPHRLFLKTSGLIARLPQMNERLRELEKRVNKLEKT
jgi:UDP-3-O-[3-hydroxymyristoyl] glucosamine N-acyltransferase